MASNYFGEVFRITTFGESHGPGVGVVIDGCPAGLEISPDEINLELAKRQPGKTLYTTSRKEADRAEIFSGVFDGKTTGAPISILIRNIDADSNQYTPFKDLYRPGHANFTYLQKYGVFDYRGGGRASARETAARVAAGAVAKKLLKFFDMDLFAYVYEIGGIAIQKTNLKRIAKSPIFCPDPQAEAKILKKILEIKEQGDSLGGIVACHAMVKPGLGEPIYHKLEAMLASAMLSIPASKGFEIGSGFDSARMLGSEHNDPFDIDGGQISPASNFSGGTLGGISTGQSIFFKVPFKPTSSIKKPQKTVSLKGEKAILTLPKTARHDPCIAIRAVPVVEAMAALVFADALLLKRCTRTDFQSVQ